MTPTTTRPKRGRPPVRALTNEQWESIKLAAIAGVSYRSLAIRYGMTDDNGKPDTATIRKRAQRGQWPIPARIRESGRRQAKTILAKAGITHNADGELSQLVTQAGKAARIAQNAAVTVTEDLAQLGEQGTLLASQLAVRSLMRAPEHLPVTSMSEAKTAMQIVRIAAGMDSGDGSRITIGLFSGGASPMAQAAIDVDAGTIEAETMDDGSD